MTAWLNLDALTAGAKGGVGAANSTFQFPASFSFGLACGARQRRKLGLIIRCNHTTSLGCNGGDGEAGLLPLSPTFGAGRQTGNG